MNFRQTFYIFEDRIRVLKFLAIIPLILLIYLFSKNFLYNITILKLK